MYRKLLALSTFIVIFLIMACGGTGSGGSSNAQVYRRNLGDCKRPQFSEALQRILFTKYNYQDSGNTRDMNAQIEYRTLWKPRFRFDDEKAMGIVKVESRIIIGAKSLGTAANLSGDASYKAYIEAENRVQYPTSTAWEPGPITEAARKYFREIAFEMEQHFKSSF